MEALDEPEAKASMIWILGEYVSRHIWGSPYMDPRIRCLERNLGYTFGGGKVSSQEVLGYQKYEQRFHFFCGWNQTDGRVQYVFSWVESTMYDSH